MGISRRLLTASSVLAILGSVTAPASAVSAAPPPSVGASAPAPQVQIEAGPFAGPSFVPPPTAPAGDELRANLAPAQSTITVNYTGFTAPAQAAFQHAVDIWEQFISSPITIEVDDAFTPLGPGVLGSAGPADIRRDFAGAPVGSRWYPTALANHLANTDLNGGDAEIGASFSSTFDFYFGTDGNVPAGQFDFVSVVLHELGHGLGFVGGANVTSGDGTVRVSGFPLRYSDFVELGNGNAITGVADPSATLASELQSDDLWFDATNATAANGGAPVPLFAPNPWNGGSSYSHLDEASYLPGNVNSLMTPQIGAQEAVHVPGPVTLGIFRDLGWTIAAVPNNQPVAANDAYATNEDVPLVVFAPGVLANDTDDELDPLTAVLVTPPAHGSVGLNGNGGFTYTPAANYSGPDSFTYTANDATQPSAPATVSITVNAVNDAPVAVDDAFVTLEDFALNDSVAGNDSDPEGDVLTFSKLTDPSNGAVVVNADGTFTYTPNPDYHGPDSFTYQACDPGPLCDSATVNITVTSDATSFVEFSSANYAAIDARRSPTLLVPITVLRTGDLSATSTVDYATSDGTATEGLGNDYLSAAGTFTFTPGQSSKTFYVRILVDQVVEGPETINLALFNTDDKTDPVAPSNAVITIND